MPEVLNGIGDSKSHAILWHFFQKNEVNTFKSGELLLPAYLRHRADKPCASPSTSCSAGRCLNQSIPRKRKITGNHREIFWGVDSTKKKTGFAWFSYKSLSCLEFTFNWADLLRLATSNIEADL